MTTTTLPTMPPGQTVKLVGYRHNEWVTDGVFAVLDDDTRVALGYDVWRPCIEMWNQLDDMRISGRLPGVKFLVVRSVDDPAWNDAPRGSVRVAASPTPHRDKVRAAKAWAKRNGFAGRVGGWIYDPSGRPVTQGWFGFASILVTRGKVFEVNGSWYEGVGR